MKYTILLILILLSGCNARYLELEATPLAQLAHSAEDCGVLDPIWCNFGESKYFKGLTIMEANKQPCAPKFPAVYSTFSVVATWVKLNPSIRLPSHSETISLALKEIYPCP